MAFSRRLYEGDTRIKIVIPDRTQTRLFTTCFRGKALQLGGNFSRWSSAIELFSDEIILDNFKDEILELSENGCFGQRSFTIEYEAPVGWESTDEVSKYNDDDLELFFSDSKSWWAMRVKKERTDILAPSTQDVTIRFQLKFEYDGIIAVVYSIYPGKDVGHLEGDITKNEKRVFFD